VDSSKVGIRLSPFGTAFGCTDLNPREIFDYVVKKLNDYDLAYLHIVEPRGMQQPAPDAPEGGVTTIYRKMYDGVLISASGYDGAEVRKVVEKGTTDVVAFARDFISNPYLVERIRTGAEFSPVNWETCRWMCRTRRVIRTTRSSARRLRPKRVPGTRRSWSRQWL
jgi:N-ethylmaleimide reductase